MTKKKSHLITLLSLLLLPALMTAFASCKSDCIGTALTTDSIKIENNEDSLATASLVFDYPTEGRPKMLDSVRAYINETLYHCFYPGENGKSKYAELYMGDLESGKKVGKFYGKAFAEEMKQMRHADGMDKTSAPYSHYLTLRKVEDTDFFTSYVLHNYWYTGGAHGSDFTEGATISKFDGHVLSYPIDTLRLMDIQPLLAQGIADYLNTAKQWDDNITAKNIRDYLFLSGDTIPLPAARPYLTAKGIMMVYQQYEIGPYAMGQPSFVIPYDKVMPFLTKDAKSVITPMLEIEKKENKK